MLAEALRLATWLGFERKVVLHYIKNFRLATGVGHFFATYIAVCILRSILPSILPSILLSIYCRPYIERPYIKRPYIAVQYIAVHILNVHILNVHIAVYIAVCYSKKVSYCTYDARLQHASAPHSSGRAGERDLRQGLSLRRRQLQASSSPLSNDQHCGE